MHDSRMIISEIRKKASIQLKIISTTKSMKNMTIRDSIA